MEADHMLATLIQIPFLAAFIWFSLRLQNEFRNDSKEREKTWMTYLAAEREQRKHAMQSGMDQVTQMTHAMASITEALMQLTREIVDHNASSHERHDAIIRSIDALHRRLDAAGICKYENHNG